MGTKHKAGRLLRAVGLYPAASVFRDLLRNPQATVNRVAAAAARRLGPLSPRSLPYRLLERLYVDHLPWLHHTRPEYASATAFLNRLGADGPPSPQAGRALVFLLRGQWYGPALFSYLVACSLRRLGYRVSLVTCGGSVEHCGNSQEGHPLLLPPPLACGTCKLYTATYSSEGFEVLSLKDFRTAEEDARVAEFAKLSGAEMRDYQMGGVRLSEALRPYLLRYYHGDYRKVESLTPETVTHFQAGLRYLLRYRRLLDQARPSCLCLFNGVFFPESLFLSEARARGIATLCTERGMRRNTMFLSLDEPACHYRSDRLWEETQERIGAEQVEAARLYMETRLAGPEDPHGVRRAHAGPDEAKHRELARTPYAVFFAPVTHDTAAMGKDDPFGGFAFALEALARLAIAVRKRLVVRSHPDERSSLNPSRYPVRQFLADRKLLHDDYVVCLDSDEKWNPYTLARLADASVVYNGTLGFELPALGYRVFNIATSHYSNKGFTADVRGPEDLRQAFQVEGNRCSAEATELALKYLHYYAHIACVPMDRLLDECSPNYFRVRTDDPTSGQVEQLRAFTDRVGYLLSPYPDPAEPVQPTCA